MTIAWMILGLALGCVMAWGQVLAERRSLLTLVSTVVSGALAAVALVVYLGEWTAVGPVLLGYWCLGALLGMSRPSARP